MSMTACPHCGKELPSDSKFCQFCGEKLVGHPVVPAAAKPVEVKLVNPANIGETQSADRGNRPSKRNVAFIITAILAAVLLAGNVYQYLVIQRLKPSIPVEMATENEVVFVPTTKEDIPKWLEQHGDEYKQYSEFYANGNSVTVKVGQTSTLVISKNGDIVLSLGVSDSKICSAQWKYDKYSKNTSTASKRTIEVTGKRVGVTAVTVTRKDTGDSFSILVDVIP